jgi:hypothetical protein
MALACLPTSGNGKRYQSASDDQADAKATNNTNTAMMIARTGRTIFDFPNEVEASVLIIGPYRFRASKPRTYPKRRDPESSILVWLEFRWRDRRCQ